MCVTFTPTPFEGSAVWERKLQGLAQMRTNGFRSMAVRFFVVLIAAVGFFFALLEPLGGLEKITNASAQKLLIWSLFVALAVLCGVVAALWGADSLGGDATSEHNAGTLDSSLRTILRCGGSRRSLNYHEMAARTVSRFWAVGVSLPSFSTATMLSQIEKMVDRNVDVRFIVVNPLSPELCGRPDTLYEHLPPPAKSSAESIKIWHLFRSRALKPPGERLFRFAVTRELPSVGMVVADGEVMWSPFLLNSTGGAAPYLVHQTSDESFGAKLVRHFDMLWAERATKIGDLTADALTPAHPSNDELQAQIERRLKLVSSVWENMQPTEPDSL